jgi:hypothetical protein
LAQLDLFGAIERTIPSGKMSCMNELFRGRALMPARWQNIYASDLVVLSAIPTRVQHLSALNVNDFPFPEAPPHLRNPAGGSNVGRKIMTFP